MDFRTLGPITQGLVMDIRSSLMLWLMLATGVAAANEASSLDTWTDQRIEAAFHDVLAHGDLSDIGFLEKKLGLTLEVTDWEIPSFANSVESTAIATVVPPYFHAYGTSYQLRKNTEERTTLINVNLGIRSCPSIGPWGIAWNQHVEESSGMADDMETLGSTETIRWQQDPEGVVLRHDVIGGGCIFMLQQKKHAALSLPKPPAPTPGPGTQLLEQVIDLVAASDLRDYDRTGRIFHVKMSTYGELRGHRLYNGGAVPEQIIPDTVSSFFAYDVNDTGWLSAGHPINQRRRIAKTASIWMYVDTTTACISPDTLQARMRQRHLRFRKVWDEEAKETVLRVLKWGDVFTVRYDVAGTCVSELKLQQ
jgi:hypothetical protein